MKYIGLIIAMLLLLCITSMPYEYYELVRYLTTILFFWMAFKAYRTKNENLTFVYVAIAILFQPFFKITLSKVIWNVIDVIVAALLIILYVKDIKGKKS